MDPRSRTPLTPQNRHSTPGSSQNGRGDASLNSSRQPYNREATLKMVRQQIDKLYSGSVVAPPDTVAKQKPQTLSTPNQVTHQPNLQPINPYDKTHTRPELQNPEQWKKYHSAWQNYYQKYYEQYYITEVSKAIKTDGSSTVESPASKTTNSGEPKALTQKEALAELRENIREKAQTTANKARGSRHFMPIASAFVVVLAFALLQYNQVLIANVKAYVTPGNIEPQNIIVDPTTAVPVGPETKMIIPKINVDAPVVMNVGPTNQEQLQAMSNGIAHVKYPGASSSPGQTGNTVFSAHSSSDWLDTGAYKFIFVQLERLAKGDVIYINYKSKQYSYKVFKTSVVPPNDINSLRYTGSDPIITLITCTPLGTAKDRLLVFAKQISPDPSGAAKAPTASEKVETSSLMTGTAPTFLERLFGAR
jgi:sortase A